MSIRILTGDCRDVLKTLPDQSVHCVVTSPPYFGLRDYQVAGQIGLEPTPAEFVAEMVAVFAEVRRVLRDDGTLWLNLGDSYARSPAKGGSGPNGINKDRWGYGEAQQRKFRPGSGRADGVVVGLKEKDLIGIPWRVAFALQSDGWYLRQDIIWSKPNPMPESVRDRCTKAHEYLFLLSKSARYFYDADAITEPLAAPENLTRTAENGKGNGELGKGARFGSPNDGRNKRSVWEVATAPFSEAHFATFPPALIEPCIKAGCPEKCCAKCGAPWVREVETGESVGRRDSGGEFGGVDLGMSRGRAGYRSVVTLGFAPSCSCNAATVPGTVLDPFGGAGTTGLVADRLGRNAILIELNPAYAEMARKRLSDDAGMFAEVA